MNTCDSTTELLDSVANAYRNTMQIQSEINSLKESMKTHLAQLRNGKDIIAQQLIRCNNTSLEYDNLQFKLVRRKVCTKPNEATIKSELGRLIKKYLDSPEAPAVEDVVVKVMNIMNVKKGEDMKNILVIKPC